MTLFEVLASAGGISKNNNARKIKIIRKTKKALKFSKLISQNRRHTTW